MIAGKISAWVPAGRANGPDFREYMLLWLDGE